MRALLLSGVLLLAAGALAEEPTADEPTAGPTALGAPTGAPAPPPAPEVAAPTGFSGWLEETLHGSRPWSQGSTRLFFAEQLDVGYLYVRARSWFGYGQPHHTWFGLELNPQLQSGVGLGLFAGLAGGWRFVSARAGVRPFMSLERNFLPAAESHERVEFTVSHGRAKYVTLEAEVSANLPLGPGEVLLLASLSNVLGVPEGMHVYEETLRIIVEPPWVWRARGGYALHVVKGKQHSVGVVVDVFGVPARDMLQIRAGVVATLKLSEHLEARLSLVPTVYSKDHLGQVTSDITELGLRYRFATGK